jgi:hypothetical protein
MKETERYLTEGLCCYGLFVELVPSVMWVKLQATGRFEGSLTESKFDLAGRCCLFGEFEETSLHILLPVGMLLER